MARRTSEPRTPRQDPHRPAAFRREVPHVNGNATDRDQNAELERPLKLGERPADIGRTGAAQWHIPADPELSRTRLS